MKKKLTIAVIGSGGREHALAWKLGRSPKVEALVLIPGNGGTEPNIGIDIADIEALKQYCLGARVDLVVVGPETPLCEGIVDAFDGTGIRVFGPHKAAARLEGSKIYSKNFMKKYGVATADFAVFGGADDPAEMIRSHKGKVVVKYDGLAAGKGVYVCSSEEEARAAVADIRAKYGENANYLIETKLQGQELSVIGITDGKSINCLLPSQDHKAALDGDKGPNTGGMGAYCPAPAATEAVLDAIDETIILPTLNGIEAEGFRYRGVIYFGIMLTETGPKLLEYNVRFGDPETEVILPSLKSDLLDLILAAFDGTLGDIEPEFSENYFVDVVLASGGYPGPYEKNKLITGIADLAADTLCFHSGTKREGEALLTSGGRVLNIVCNDKDLKTAVDTCYREIRKVSFDSMYCRKDIAHRALGE
ncbi:MAG: phosphoribosylamine--glycine ligase [Candidatus Marinimicrobia bacterium]|nr:phosphoribosylamine--glycine ligase [Candidatus Neomarinimicrobiota bacterium]